MNRSYSKKLFNPKPMPIRGHIRYYPAFRLTIPVFRARCSCITPPFATVQLLGPFDLHVLGTPPAFVLSHDQTLRRKCLFSQMGLLAMELALHPLLSWL